MLISANERVNISLLEKERIAADYADTLTYLLNIPAV
jgi:hypothetical protein